MSIEQWSRYRFALPRSLVLIELPRKRWSGRYWPGYIV